MVPTSYRTIDKIFHFFLASFPSLICTVQIVPRAILLEDFSFCQLFCPSAFSKHIYLHFHLFSLFLFNIFSVSFCPFFKKKILKYHHYLSPQEIFVNLKLIDKKFSYYLNVCTKIFINLCNYIFCYYTNYKHILFYSIRS